MIKVNSFKMQRLLSLRNAMFIAISIVSSASVAETLNITASFSPSPTQPGNNKFINTTPISGYCAHYPAACKPYDMFSIQTNFTTEALGPIEANEDDQRKGAMIKIPGAPRKVLVRNTLGDTEELIFRVSGIGLNQRFNPNVDVITENTGGHPALWEGGRWTNPPPNCGVGNIGLGAGNNTSFAFFWRKDGTDAICSKKALFKIPVLTYSAINFAYELTTPNPLDMLTGEYTGQLILSIGNGGDFDFGDQMRPTDSNLTINFSLSVTHILDVKFPPNSHLLSLNPEGGWQQWLHRGRRPEKLFANQSFQIWSSATFKMLLECQYPVANQCGIQNEAGDLVPVETRVTLPSGLLDLSGMAVNRYLLSNSNPSVFHPAQYVDNGRAALHFEVSRDSVAQMTNYAGSRYSGNVTIVWDSEI